MAQATGLVQARDNVRLAASYVQLGRPGEVRRALQEAERNWPCDTVSIALAGRPIEPKVRGAIARFQMAMRLAGQRDHADKNAESGQMSDAVIHTDLAGPTPTTAPGAARIKTETIGGSTCAAEPGGH